jgi:hypothetical protein
MALLSRYQQALAQPASRKLALLVGINQYPESVCDYTVRGTALNGCLTDVELQRELLIHRFGFQPSDILTLTDQAATHQAITAALGDLSQQVKPEDIVLFHFSGLGSQVQLESSALQQPQNSLVPVDGVLPSTENPVVSDLLLDTLGLLLYALPTQQVITVLDACHTSLGRTLQGNLRIRSRPNSPTGALAARELALRQQLQQPHRAGPSSGFPGMVLQASAPDRIATEVQWNGFSSGLFTYALTQQLWSSTAATPLWVSFNQATTAVRQIAGLQQQPVQTGAKPATLTDSIKPISADGVIRAVEEDGRAQIWLAGLPAAVLENASGSLFTVLSDQLSNPLVQLRSRDGLSVKARKSPDAVTLQPGLLVQEAVRVLPRNIGLTVALDNSLERIERVDATSAFAAIPRVSAVIAGEPADYLFGKTQAAPLIAASLPSQPTNDELPTSSSYGLFYPDRNAVPNTLIQNTEAVKTAVNRLTPQLKTLLAIKLLRLTQNRASSQLSVRATLETVSPQRQLLQQETTRILVSTPKAVRPLIEANSAVPVDSQIRYRLENYGQAPVYFTLISIDTRGNFSLLPPRVEVTAGATVTVPSRDSGWSIQSPVGLAETHLIFSRTPLTQTAQLLEANPANAAGQPLPVPNPLEVVQAVLQDLHQASSATVPSVESPVDSYLLDVQAWATLSFIYRVA